MYRVRTVTDIGECRELWQRLMPTELVSDLWEVRDCFHRHYNHPLHFVVAEESGAVKGFLPLSRNEETGQYNYFPGETWEGKTWLEQNRIIAGSEEILSSMLASLAGPYQLRYLRADGFWGGTHERVDEIGYLFVPESYQYDMNRYFETFSHKTAKRLRKELAGWDSRALEWRYNQPEYFEILCQMNISRFGNLSYFHDYRFLESFRSLMHLLRERDWLRIVTIVVDGEPAAVDLGSLYNGMLTMLAGGTSAGFPGIAKLINVHHMTYACEHKLDSVDFLCGDFNWKTLFHLTPAPLYLIERPARVMPVERASAAQYTSKPAIWSAVPGAPNA